MVYSIAGFSHHVDEWEAVLQPWEFKQHYVEPDEVDNEEAH